MQPHDIGTFAKLLDKVWGLKAQVLTVGQKQTYFDALSGYALNEVAAGLNAHVQDPERGQFLPMPADIIRQILQLVAADGRPSADEAWATAVRSMDETDTIVWSQEISSAWVIARPIMDNGDEIGARLAFRDAYKRLVTSARERRIPVSWTVSEGFDPAKRRIALERAAETQLLPHDEVVALIGGPPTKGLGDLLASPDIPEHAREAIERFKKRVAEKAAAPGADAIAKQRTQSLKDEADQRTRDYLQGDHE